MLYLDLRRLFLLLTVAAVLLTFANSYYATYQVQKQLLINTTLEANRVYAAKLAETTNNFLQSAQAQLAYSAAILAKDFSNEALLENEATRLYLQSNYFNSVSIINSEAIIATVFPVRVPVKGLVLPEATRQSFNTRQPLVADPFLSPSGQYLVSISHPIFNSQGDYLGYVAGTIYLHDNNVFFKLLGQHPYNDGSYIYVVDRHREIIYHLHEQRIGDRVHNNAVLNASIAGEWGSAPVINSLDIPMLAGYAHIERAGWGVVTQRPLSSVMAELDIQLMEVVWKSMPVLWLTLLIVWLAARFITKPLQALARHASDMDKSYAEQNIDQIKAWYFEVQELKHAILRGLGVLNHRIHQLDTDSNTDPLTQLYNRRGLDKILEQWQQQKQSFSVIALDIDHFKVVNDTFGHDVGDDVLQQLCRLMQQAVESNSVLCRSGGEEFLILLPVTPVYIAQKLAERLRILVSEYAMPKAGTITISLGIAYWDAQGDDSIKTVLKIADIALYQAKRQGRNRSVVASHVAQI